MWKQQLKVPVAHRSGLAQNLLNPGQAKNNTEQDMLMDLDSYRKAKAAKFVEVDCDVDQLCVNGNAAVRLVALSCYQRPRELSPELPEDFSTVDVPGFMDRVYALATQI